MKHTQDRELFSRMRGQAAKAGFFHTTPIRYGFLFCFTIAIYFISLIALFFVDGWLRVLCIFCISFGVVQGAYLAHDAGHNEISRKQWVNDLVGHIGMSFFGGFSFSFWRQQHNQHHIHSQIESRDPDMQSSLVGLYEDSARKKRGLGRWITAYQGYLLFLIYGFHPFQLKGDGILYLLKEKRGTWPDWLAIALHSLVLIVLPIWFLGPLVAIVNYLAMSMLAGYMYGPTFAMNHIGTESFTSENDLSFWRRQILGSRNVRIPRLIDPFIGGLNYQIEHHLFPSVSRFNYPDLALIVKQECHAARIPYREESFPRAMWNVVSHLHDLSRLQRNKQPTSSLPASASSGQVR